MIEIECSEFIDSGRQSRRAIAGLSADAGVGIQDHRSQDILGRREAMMRLLHFNPGPGRAIVVSSSEPAFHATQKCVNRNGFHEGRDRGLVACLPIRT
jgi:hypothetical protein